MNIHTHMTSNTHDRIASYTGLTAEIVTQLASELLLEKLKLGPSLTSPAATLEFLTTKFHGASTEQFLVIYMDTRHRVLDAVVEFQGTIDGAAVYPRVICEQALKKAAAAVIIAHNHPSGVHEPSRADENITRRIKDALNLLEIRLLDHLVIGANGRYTSLATTGRL